MAEVGLQAAGGDEALQLCLDLGVGQACDHRGGRRALSWRIRMGVDQRTAEWFASMAAASGRTDAERTDRRRAFWRWYLDEAVPAAYESAAD